MTTHYRAIIRTADWLNRETIQRQNLQASRHGRPLMPSKVDLLKLLQKALLNMIGGQTSLQKCNPVSNSIAPTLIMGTTS